MNQFQNYQYFSIWTTLLNMRNVPPCVPLSMQSGVLELGCANTRPSSQYIHNPQLHNFGNMQEKTCKLSSYKMTKWPIFYSAYPIQIHNTCSITISFTQIYIPLHQEIHILKYTLYNARTLAKEQPFNFPSSSNKQGKCLTNVGATAFIVSL